MKSENDETCRGIVLSHVESMVKNWEGFEQVAMSDAWNLDIPFSDFDRSLGGSAAN
jgi:hypothetical protein